MSDRWLPSGRVAQVRRYVSSGSGPVHAWSCMEGCGCGFWATLCPPGTAHEARFLASWWPYGGRWLWIQQPAFSRLPGPGSSSTIPASSVRKKARRETTTGRHRSVVVSASQSGCRSSAETRRSGAHVRLWLGAAAFGEAWMTRAPCVVRWASAGTSLGDCAVV